MAVQRRLSPEGMVDPGDQDTGGVSIRDLIDSPSPMVDDGIMSGAAGRSGESPRERVDASPGANPAPTPAVNLRDLSGGAESPTEAAPPRPSEPTPMAGSSFNSGMVGGLTPFQPMGTPDIGSMATPRSQGVYGGPGGLTGGGFGVPLDPTSNAQSDPIDTLIKYLLSSSKQSPY